jgi:quinol monooxygenase YgiN
MLVIAGTITIDPEKRELAIAAVRELMAETRKEAGCVAYNFAADLADPGQFWLFEEWESQTALEAHTKAPHMKRFQAAIPSLGFRGMKAKRYEVSSAGPLR